MSPLPANEACDPSFRPAPADKDVNPNDRNNSNEQPSIGRDMQGGREFNTQVQPRPISSTKSGDSRLQSDHVLDKQGCQDREDNGGSLRDEDDDNEDHRLDVNPDPCDVAVASGRRQDKTSANLPARISSRAETSKTSRALQPSRPEESRGPGSSDAHGNANTVNDGLRGRRGQSSRKKRRRVFSIRQAGVDPSPSTVPRQPHSQKAAATRTDSPVEVETTEQGAVDVEDNAAMSTSFTALAAGRHWTVRCTPALFMISVVSAGVFVCMSLQAFSVLRTHGLSVEWQVGNRTRDSTTGAQRSAAESGTKPATPEDEGFQTASNTDVE